jgi:hypothetical protein
MLAAVASRFVEASFVDCFYVENTDQRSSDAAYDGHRLEAPRQAAARYRCLSMCLLRQVLAEVRIKQGEWSCADSAMLDTLIADAATSMASPTLLGVAEAALPPHDSGRFTTASHRAPIDDLASDMGCVKTRQPLIAKTHGN